MPASLWFQYSPLKGGSVPFCLHTQNCSGVSCDRHSFFDFLTFVNVAKTEATHGTRDYENSFSMLNGFHAQPDTALLVNLKHFHLDDIPFREFIRHAFDPFM